MSDTPTASPVVLGRWEKPDNLASIAALAAAGQVAILPHELIRTTDGRVYHWTGTALEITSAPVHHGTVADVSALDGVYLLPSCTRGVHPGDTAFVTSAGCEYRVASGVNATATWAACASLPTIPTTPSEVGADPAGSAAAAVSTHNAATDAHADLRTLVGDRVPISTTRLGTVGSVPLTTTALTAADWATLPVGWSGIISADVAVASGLPAADVFHLHKVSSRDVSGGGAYQAQGYLTPTLYVGAAATSSDLPTWHKAVTLSPDASTLSPTLNDSGAGNSLIADASVGTLRTLVSGDGVSISVGENGTLIISAAAAVALTIAGWSFDFVSLDSGDYEAWTSGTSWASAGGVTAQENISTDPVAYASGGDYYELTGGTGWAGSGTLVQYTL